jgi:hypothetical protein
MGRDGTAQLKWSGLLPELLAAVATSGRSHGGCIEPTVVRRNLLHGIVQLDENHTLRSGKVIISNLSFFLPFKPKNYL